MKFSIQENWTPAMKQSARAWNLVETLREDFGEDPTPDQREIIGGAALDWFEASARAGREVMRRG